MESKTSTIAAINEDGITISQHFGRARYFEVMYIEKEKVVKRERHEKMGHHNFAKEDHHQSGDLQGFDESSHNKHVSMAEAIKDCLILLTGGMGAGAYQSMLQLNIKPIVTDITNIDDAVHAVLNGTIIDHIDKLH